MQTKSEIKKLQLYEKLTEIERRYWNDGKIVAGVDEVGRGCLAGPLTVCAYIFKPNSKVLGVNDSKKLSPKKRTEIYTELMTSCLAYSIVEKDSKFIDDNNIYESTKIAMKEAVLSLDVVPDIVLVDAMEIDIPYNQLKIIHGDEQSISIAAASIVAKVSRDKKMIDYAKVYPSYGFDKHKGYCTRFHEQAITTNGLLDIHRRSFCKKFLNE